MSLDDQPTNDWRRIAVYSVSIAAIIVLGAWVYALPYLTVSQLQEAAKAGDSDTFAELVDFPSLRESLKETFKAMIIQDTVKVKNQGPFAGLAMIFANVMVDKFVDAAVSPSGIAAMIQGKPPTEVSDSNSEPQNVRQERAISESSKDHLTEMSMGYVNWSKFAVRFIDKKTGQEAIVLTLHRRGLSWQLSSLRLPLIFNAKTEEESIPPTTRPKASALSLFDIAWSKTNYGSLFANFTVRNTGERDVRDFILSCSTYGPSGTTLGTVSKSIYETVRANSIKEYEGVEIGLVNPQTATVQCEASAKAARMP